jgi:hypothetical protein
MTLFDIAERQSSDFERSEIIWSALLGVPKEGR